MTLEHWVIVGLLLLVILQFGLLFLNRQAFTMLLRVTEELLKEKMK